MYNIFFYIYIIRGVLDGVIFIFVDDTSKIFVFLLLVG